MVVGGVHELRPPLYSGGRNYVRPAKHRFWNRFLKLLTSFWKFTAQGALASRSKNKETTLDRLSQTVKGFSLFL